MPFSLLNDVLADADTSLVQDWVRLQREVPELRLELISSDVMLEESGAFLRYLREAVAQSSDDLSHIDAPEWASMRGLLGEVTRSRVRMGWDNAEVALFLLSFKKPLFDRLSAAAKAAEEDVVEALWQGAQLIDRLGVYATTVLIEAREETIARQREEMLELSTPVVRLWEGIIALPLIGTLDSVRTMQVMEVLLSEIDRRDTQIAILDITGVPTVDSATAQHLLQTTRAARLMGAECVISGVRPAIAQTIVSLGIDLGDLETRSSMEGALAYALRRCGLHVGKL